MKTIAIAQGAAFFQQRVELEGVNYVLDFAWCERAREWILSVYTDDGALVLSGLAIVANRKLFRRFHYLDGVPPGELVFASVAGTIDAPGYEDLTELVYFESTEL